MPIALAKAGTVQSLLAGALLAVGAMPISSSVAISSKPAMGPVCCTQRLASTEPPTNSPSTTSCEAGGRAHRAFVEHRQAVAVDGVAYALPHNAQPCTTALFGMPDRRCIS